MDIRIFQVDAFTNKVFGGNPAAVCPLIEWLEDDQLQKIAAENNLAETAFLVEQDLGYQIRWFTPTVEVDLCGHATLASAHILWNHLDFEGDVIKFWSHRSGDLFVKKEGDWLTLDFPTDSIKLVKCPDELIKAFDKAPIQSFKGLTDYLLIYSTQKDIEILKPDIGLIAKTDSRGVIISAKGDKADFVSRFFAPQSGIDEDPVTGSAHTSLIPFWSKELNKKELNAEQISERVGVLKCTDKGQRVLISGQAVTYLIGTILI